MNRKLTTIGAIAIAMSMVLSGCTSTSNNNDVAAEFNALMSNNDNKEMDATIETTTTMTSGEISMEVLVDMDMKVKQEDDDNVIFTMDMRTSAEGQEMEANTFYVDGYYYMDAYGSKMKAALSMDSAIAQLENNISFMDLSTDILTNIEKTEANGNRVYSYTGDTSKMDALMEEVMSSMGTGLSSLGDLGMTINGMQGTVTVDGDDNIIAQTITLDYTMTVEGETLQAVMVMDMVVNNPGQPVDITIPTDLDSYPEVDASLLGLE